jgi:uncharacterized protein
MLGSLARKLRIFGYDTAYFREGPDSELERVAVAESRIIITSDAALVAHARRRGLPVLAVSGRTDRSRLLSLSSRARAESIQLSPGAPRCAICNNELEQVGKAVAAASLPESVSGRHRLFYRCRECGKLYWRGRHWSRLRGLSSAMRQR